MKLMFARSNPNCIKLNLAKTVFVGKRVVMTRVESCRLLFQLVSLLLLESLSTIPGREGPSHHH